MLNLSTRRAAILSAVSFFALAGHAHAQTASSPAPQGEAADQTDTQGIDDIVVTAQKRSERLQEVPISVTALDTKQIENLNASDISGLARVTPGVHVGSFGNQQFSAVFNIRGVGVVEPDAYAGNSVSIVVDGVPQFFNYGAIVDMFDVERVEVLKGPQGTLFGANTTGGVVNLVNAQPTSNFGGYVTSSVGLLADKYMRFSIGGAINLPLANGLSARVAAYHYDQQGWIKNVEDPDSNLGKLAKTLLRGTLRYEDGDNFDATLTGEVGKINAGGNYVAQGALPGEYWYVAPGTAAPWDATVRQPAGVCASTASACSAPDVAVAAYDHTLPNESKLNNYRGVLTMNLNNTPIGDLTSITGYKSYNWMDNIDTDGTIRALNRGKDWSDGWQFTQEIRTNAKIGDSIRLVAGVYYITDFYQTARSGQSPSDHFLTITSQRQKNHSISGFANAYWDITPQLQLILGGRYSHERTSMRAATINSLDTTGLDIQGYCGTVCKTYLINSPINNTPLGGVGPVFGTDSWNNTAWKVGLNFTPVDGVLTYASISRGFKSGGFTGRIGTPSDLGPYQPEQVTTYELGLKADWLDRHLRTNVSVFYNDYKDIQLGTSYVYIDSNGLYANGSTIQNAAAAKIKGAEFEIVAMPTDQLRLGVSGTYLDAKYDSFLYQLVGTTGTPVTVDYSGVPLQNAPKFSYSLYGDYTIPAGSGNLTLHADFAHTGKKLQIVQPEARSFLKATDLLNARIEWAPNGDAWSISIWANNLTDNRYFKSAYTAPTVGSIYQFADPREFGATLKANF